MSSELRLYSAWSSISRWRMLKTSTTGPPALALVGRRLLRDRQLWCRLATVTVILAGLGEIRGNPRAPSSRSPLTSEVATNRRLPDRDAARALALPQIHRAQSS